MARHGSLTFELDLYVELSCYDVDLFFQILLGRNHITKSNVDDVNSFASPFYCHVVHCTVMYNRSLMTVTTEVSRHV